jgi:Rad3-related DNA helicase
MCGIPYPQIFDPKVMIKKDYLDKKKKSGQQMIDGNEWYKL